MGFLTELFHNGLGYSALNSARSALSSFIQDSRAHCPIGQSPDICRFIAGVFNSRPSLPRYTETWDLDPVLTWMKSLEPLHAITFKELTLKLVMLLVLTTGKRGQSIHLLKTGTMSRTPDHFRFVLTKPVKNYRAGMQKELQEVFITKFPEDSMLCPYTVLSFYLHKTSSLRGLTASRVLLSYQKPHKPVSRATVSRWVKSAMELSGVDTSIFKPHSTRSASVSKAANAGVPLADILKSAGWRTDQCFAKHYLKPIQQQQVTYSTTVLRRKQTRRKKTGT